jgi:hypothetical protein
MHRRLRSSLWLLLLVAGLNAVAQPVEYSSSDEAISALFPGERVAEWTRTTGDFNSDGIGDLALIITLVYDDAPIQTRLVILAGSPGGTYSTMSASSKYCDAQKFFNLEAKGASLHVSAVQKADASEIASETLQFQFNRQLGDLELIGREDAWESYTEKSYGRLSINYKAGRAVEYARERDRIKETRRSKLAVSRLARLNGFDCDKWRSGGLY